MKARVPWWLPSVAALGAVLLRLLGRTWRVIPLPGFEARDRSLREGAPCIYALWHSRLLPLAYTHRGRGVAVLVSRHRDGEWIARIIERLGYTTARGSSTRGGEDGVRGLLEFARAGRALTMTPDGPRGPCERAKSGVAYLASRTGLPVIPTAAAARSEWVFRSWDRFRVPHPFARVAVAYGEPVIVPPELDAEELEPWRVRIEAAITEVTASADRAVAAHADSLVAREGSP